MGPGDEAEVGSETGNFSSKGMNRTARSCAAAEVSLDTASSQNRRRLLSGAAVEFQLSCRCDVCGAFD